MPRKVILPAIFGVFLGVIGASESTGQDVVERPRLPTSRQEGVVRVQMSIQLFVAGPTDVSEEADRQRDRARRVIYEIAAKECDLLREVVARDCRLETVNVNLSRQPNPQMQGYQVGGNMIYQITLK